MKLFLSTSSILSNDTFLFRSSHGRCSVKRHALKNFAKFSGKHLWDSGTGVFLWLLRNFEEHLFYRIPLKDYFCLWLEKVCYDVSTMSILSFIDNNNLLSSSSNTNTARQDLVSNEMVFGLQVRLHFSGKGFWPKHF